MEAFFSGKKASLFRQAVEVGEVSTGGNPIPIVASAGHVGVYVDDTPLPAEGGSPPACITFPVRLPDGSTARAVHVTSQQMLYALAARIREWADG